MKPVQSATRLITLAVVFILILLLFSLRLMQLQVVEGDRLAAELDAGTTSEQAIKAARGEILDRNGRPLAVNTVGRDVVINMAYMEKGSTNAVIKRLIEIMEAAAEGWTDNLPISAETPFRFKDGEEYKNAIARLKDTFDLGQFATADDVIYHMRKAYKLEEAPDSEFRKIAGVRYEMQRRGFSMQTPYTFATNIKIETVPKIKERSFELPGVDVVESTLRQYVSGDIAPHLIGQIGPIYKEQWDASERQRNADGSVSALIGGMSYSMNDQIGKSGAELAFESYLKGADGKRKIITNSSGDVIDVVEEQAPVAGNSVVLTTDSRLQKVAQDALEAKIIAMQNDLVNYPVGEGHEANAGAVAVLDVKTGEILALASYPSFNLTTYQKDYDLLAADPLNPLFNRALSASYTPGSIFKPVVALGALAEGITLPDTHVLCGLVYTRFQDYQPRCLYAHGQINVTKALRESCNIYFYDTGWNLGIRKLDEYAQKLGFGQATGIELPENKGQVASPELKAKVHDRPGDDPKWRDGDVLQASIGQQDTMASPLQLASYAATLASNGLRKKVTILKSVKSYSFDETVYEHQPEIVETIDAPAAFQTIREGMVAASRAGTARGVFANYPIDVASKTGTPETHQYPNSTFIAYAPADDPQIAVCVIIEKGWHGYTGAPVAKEIFDAYFFSNNSKSAAAPDYGTLIP